MIKSHLLFKVFITFSKIYDQYMVAVMLLVQMTISHVFLQFCVSFMMSVLLCDFQLFTSAGVSPLVLAKVPPPA